MFVKQWRKRLRDLLEQMHRRPERNRGLKAERGMTLVEVMVVVVIISMVAGIVGVTVFGRFKEAQRRSAYVQIKNISDALDLYKLAMRRYPSTAEGLQSLTQPKGNQEPFMQSIPKDPWGNDYVYIYPGQHNSSSFDIMSYGPDGVQGGGDDVNNWEDPDAPQGQG